MRVLGRFTSQEARQPCLSWRGTQEIISPGDVVHSGRHVIDDDREVVGERPVAPDEDEIIHHIRDLACEAIRDRERCPVAANPECRWAFAAFRVLLPLRETEARPGVGPVAVTMRGRRGLQDLAPRAETLIGPVLQLGERVAVDIEPLGLADRLAVPIETKRPQVRQVAGLCTGGRAHSGLVEILDAHEPLPTSVARKQPAGQRRAQVPQMEVRSRGRRVAIDVHCSSVGAGTLGQQEVRRLSADKSERVLNLLVALLTTNRFLTKQELRDMVDGYRDVKSFERTFERDKDELRQLGVPIETGTNDPTQDEHDGYRINRRDFELPEIEFTADERLAVGLAAHAWQSSIGADATSEALKRLRAAGAAPDVGRLPQILAHIPVTEGSFDAIYQALFARREIRFDYDGKLRRVQPWRLYQRRGQWLILGWDLDRSAPRRFKLNRIDREAQLVGREHAYEIPDDVSEHLESPATAHATVAIGDAPELLAGADPVEWEGELPDGFAAYEVSRLHEQMIIDDVVVAGADAFILAPEEIRERVIDRLRRLAGEEA